MTTHLAEQQGRRDGRGDRRRDVVTAVKRAAPLAVLLVVVMCGLGLLITRVLESTWPMTAEDGVNRELEGDRTPFWNGVTHALTMLASTQGIIATTIVIAIALRLVVGRWRESAFLVTAVAMQSTIFVLVTLVVSRDRPDVDRMDPSPPTSSFPSGHTGASVALYLGLAVLLLWRTRRSWWRSLLGLVLIAIPLAVAFARMYRGMHHPTDTVGSLIQGGSAVAISAWAVLQRTAHNAATTTGTVGRSVSDAAGWRR